MKKKNLISKWLDFNLSDTEKEAFNHLDVSDSYHRLDRAAQFYKAPELDTERSYGDLRSKLGSQKRPVSVYRYVSAIAAVLIVAFGLFYFLNSANPVEYAAGNADRVEFSLPDDSEVVLNAGSSITFKESNWANNREVKLNGEAYFKVAKGSKFEVLTSQGSVSVLGTQFSVKDRVDYFEVSCFEGSVRVVYEGSSEVLSPGETFKGYADVILNDKTELAEPSWLSDKSIFKSVPYRQVVDELERQYDIQISGNSTDSNTLFTGSFSNQNLETALQAITIPLNLSYSIDGKSVVLKK